MFGVKLRPPENPALLPCFLHDGSLRPHPQCQKKGAAGNVTPKNEFLCLEQRASDA